jgi:glycosyltransferase involved in cell wall biosynthesis
MSLEHKLSIITIAYNAYNEGLEQTIKSVIEQKNENIEYILIDGGSNDDSYRIYEKYNNHFDYFLSESDKGISDAFNKGVMSSKGDYIWFLNAGDYLNTGSVERVLDFLSHNDESIIYGDMFWVDEKETTLLCPSSNYQKKIRYIMPFLHPSTVVNKGLFDDVGYFDINLKRAMDYDLLLRGYLASHRAIKIGYPLAYMTAGGVHDEDYFETLKEVRNISIKNGSNPILSSVAMVYTYLNKKSRLFFYIKEHLRKII